MNYEGQICRTTFEKSSMMLPVAVGCAYNRCTFCVLFKHLSYRLLPREEVEAELRRVSDLGGNPRHVFLGDGNAFGMQTPRLLRILAMVRAHFPACEMVNMDATVSDILAKSDDELAALHEAGATHLYLGIESGLDDVLAFMKKDHTLAQARLAIERIQRAGMVFDAHIMTGVAGRGRGAENARHLSRFLNETGPQRVTNFSLFLHACAPLYQDVLRGRFEPADELESLEEERLLIESLQVEGLRYDGFHDAIELRVWGTLPQDREKMVSRLDDAIKTYQGREPVYARAS